MNAHDNVSSKKESVNKTKEDEDRDFYHVDNVLYEDETGPGWGGI